MLKEYSDQEVSKQIEALEKEIKRLRRVVDKECSEKIILECQVDECEEEITQLKESLESKEEVIKQCLEMGDNNEQHHDYTCATDSVRAILTNPNK